MVTPETSISRHGYKHLPWKWIIAGTLLTIIAASTVYIAIATYQSRTAKPAYYAQMQGTYCAPANGRCIRLSEKGYYDFAPGVDDPVGIGANGDEWIMEGNSVLLLNPHRTPSKAFPGSLQVIDGNQLYDAKHDIYFTKTSSSY